MRYAYGTVYQHSPFLTVLPYLTTKSLASIICSVFIYLVHLSTTTAEKLTLDMLVSPFTPPPRVPTRVKSLEPMNGKGRKRAHCALGRASLKGVSQVCCQLCLIEGICLTHSFWFLLCPFPSPAKPLAEASV